MNVFSPPHTRKQSLGGHLLTALVVGALTWSSALAAPVPADLKPSGGAGLAQQINTIAQQAYLKASNTGTNDQFGYSVSISGDTMVVGAAYEASSSAGVNGNQSDNSALLPGTDEDIGRTGKQSAIIALIAVHPR